MASSMWDKVIDPMELASLLWPDVTFYKQQREIIYSVAEDDETIVPAGNMLGKDFVAGFIALWFFLTRTPCRVVTTSADHSQLEAVLWGEIRRFLQTSRYALDVESGGPLVINHLQLKKVDGDRVCGLSYMIGRVAAKGEGLLGHHIAETGDGVPRTLFICDEASGADDIAYERADTWARRKLVIGNPYPCENFFKHAVKGKPDGSVPGGDIPRPGTARGFYRRVIQIRGEDSPNVRYAQAQAAAGIPVTGEIILPGVLPWADYRKRRDTWDPIRQTIGLDAEFYEGADIKLFPPDWISLAERYADELGGKPRKALAIGIDPAEGGDKTAMAAVDQLGLIELVARKTPNTDDIPREALAFMHKHGVKPENVAFDRGGGGKIHADRLREQGYPVRTVAFGEPVLMDLKRGVTLMADKVDNREERYAYKSRRCELYGTLRELLDPSAPQRFALPRKYTAIRQQLAPIPLTYDGEGRLSLPPKNKVEGSTKKSLVELIGHSPDESDALVLAVHAMLHKPVRAVAGPARS